MGTFAGQHNEKASNIIFFKERGASHKGRAGAAEQGKDCQARGAVVRRCEGETCPPRF